MNCPAWVSKQGVHFSSDGLGQFFAPGFSWAEYQHRVAISYSLNTERNNVILIALENWIQYVISYNFMVNAYCNHLLWDSK